MWSVDNTRHIGHVCDSWSEVIGFINSSLKQSQNGWNFSQDLGWMILVQDTLEIINFLEKTHNNIIIKV